MTKYLIWQTEWGNKLSLKDRLNTQNTNSAKLAELKETITSAQYYTTSDEANNTVTLGVLDNLIKDDDIHAIFVNGAKNIFIERKSKVHRSTTTFRDEIQLENIIKKFALNEEDFIKFNYKTGINITATLPPLTNVSTIYVKCYNDKFATLEHLEEQKFLSKEMSIFFETLLKSKNNVIIAGKRKALKTTFLSALTKKTLINNRYANIDYSKEIELKRANFTNYDLSDTKDSQKRESILKSVFLSNPETIFLNDFDFENDSLIKNLLGGFKGIFLNIEAQNKEEALDKISIEIMKFLPHISFEEAKKEAYRIFDFIVFIEDEKDVRLKSLSEVVLREDTPLFNDIFLVNESNIHYSTGYIPEILLNSNSDSINLNIFANDYKHTYPENPFKNMEKKSINPEVLKKFKKDLNPDAFEEYTKEHSNTEPKEENIYEKIDSKIQEENENHTEEMTEKVEIVYDEEFMKKAQEKFDEVRKNLKNEENNQ